MFLWFLHCCCRCCRFPSTSYWFSSLDRSSPRSPYTTCMQTLDASDKSPFVDNDAGGLRRQHEAVAVPKKKKKKNIEITYGCCSKDWQHHVGKNRNIFFVVCWLFMYYGGRYFVYMHQQVGRFKMMLSFMVLLILYSLIETYIIGLLA